MKQLFSESAYWGYLIVFFLVLLIPIGFLTFILFRNKRYMFYFMLTALIPVLAGAAASFFYYISDDARLQSAALSPLYFGLAMSVPIIIMAFAGILLTSNKKGNHEEF